VSNIFRVSRFLSFDHYYFSRDYAPAPELDYYDPNVLDDEEVHETYEKRIRDRLAAEEELDAMDAKRRAREMEADYNVERFNQYERRELAEGYEEEEEGELMDEGAERALNLEKFECPLKEWIAEDRTRREIQRRFRKFLVSYYDGIKDVAEWMKAHENFDPLPPLPSSLQAISKNPIYPKKIMTMCAANKASLEVSYTHLATVQALLAIWLTDVPRDMLQIFDEVLQSVVLLEFPHYSKISNELRVRIVDLPISDRLRDLRQNDINNLVRVSGVVTRRTGVFPQLLSVAYDCVPCGATIGPFKVNGQSGSEGGKEVRPSICASCNNHGPFRINQGRTHYGNFQKITLQETPGSVPAGRVPRYKDIHLMGDLIDSARPGEEIEVTGVYCPNQNNGNLFRKSSNGFPVFNTIIEANSLKKKSGGSNASWTEEEAKKIIQLAKDPNVRKNFFFLLIPNLF
jgi:DNA replication licensing factor MCM2